MLQVLLYLLIAYLLTNSVMVWHSGPRFQAKPSKAIVAYIIIIVLWPLYLYEKTTPDKCDCSKCDKTECPNHPEHKEN